MIFMLILKMIFNISWFICNTSEHLKVSGTKWEGHQVSNEFPSIHIYRPQNVQMGLELGYMTYSVRLFDRDSCTNEDICQIMVRRRRLGAH